MLTLSYEKEDENKGGLRVFWVVENFYENLKF
jgi:hypothetical protein